MASLEEKIGLIYNSPTKADIETKMREPDPDPQLPPNRKTLASIFKYKPKSEDDIRSEFASDDNKSPKSKLEMQNLRAEKVTFDILQPSPQRIQKMNFINRNKICIVDRSRARIRSQSFVIASKQETISGDIRRMEISERDKSGSLSSSEQQDQVAIQPKPLPGLRINLKAIISDTENSIPSEFRNSSFTSVDQKCA